MNSSSRINAKSSVDRKYDDWDEVHNQMLEVQQKGLIQKKSLPVSDPEDTEEQEADTIARKIVNGESATVHETGGAIGRKGEGEAETTPEFQSRLESSKGKGQSLPKDLKQEMGSKMGADFSNVKVHTGSEANAMNDEVNAKAFAHTNDIYFREGAYDTQSSSGKQLIAHELVHTVQQTHSGDRMIQRQPPGKKLAKPKPVRKSRVVKLVEAELKKESDKIDKVRLLELINEFSTTDIHDHFQSIMASMKEKVDNKTYLDAYIIFQDNYWFENREEVQERTKWQEENLKAVGNVKSLTAVTVYDDQIPGLWKTVGTKMTSRDSHLSTISGWKEVTGDPVVNNAVTKSTARWTELKKLISDTKFDSINGKLPATTAQDIKDEETNIGEIPGKSGDRLYNTKATMKEFISALKAYMNKKDERVVELQQYKRFDELFTQVKMYTLLKGRNVLSPSDIKALTSQESGDYTWVNVGGIDKNKPGYQNTMSVGSTYIGIAQMGAPAQTEAISWAAANGVVIPEKVDNVDTRNIPEYAVLLSAAYLSHLYDKLREKYGPRFPLTNPEMKKLIFACYNWNFKALCTCIETYVGKTALITYSAIETHMPEETQNYVKKIMQRLNG